MLKVRERRRLDAQAYVQQFIEHTGAGFVAQWLDVSAATVQRWADGRNRVPLAAITALEAHLGRLPNMRVRHWEGWRIGRDGLLYAAGSRQGYHPGDLLSRQYERAALAALQRENAELRARLQQALEAGNEAANDPLAVRLSAR